MAERAKEDAPLLRAAIKRAGSGQRLANHLGITRSRVAQWKTEGITGNLRAEVERYVRGEEIAGVTLETMMRMIADLQERVSVVERDRAGTGGPLPRQTGNG